MVERYISTGSPCLMLDNKEQHIKEKISDSELVRLSLEDKDIFYYLMKRYESKILRYIRVLTDVNREEAEDLLQDIFIKLYRNLNAFNPHLKFSSWMYRIAHNEIINHYHRNKSRLKTFSLDRNSNERYPLNEIVSDDDIYDRLISNETSDIIIKVLAKLPPKYREVLILCYFEEKKYEEISDILRKPLGTVATLIHRAKSKFKKIAELENITVTYD